MVSCPAWVAVLGTCTIFRFIHFRQDSMASLTSLNMILGALLSVGVLLGAASARQFIPPPVGITSVLSKNYPGAEILYKETHICETTPKVRAWSGYVHLPSSLNPDANYDTNLFFWYFESRNDTSTSPTTLYLPGGPGTSFLDGGGGFPCTVNSDSNSTTLNPWSMNGATNMLYIDSPVQTGFSYTKPSNGAFDLLTSTFVPVQGDFESLPTNLTTVPATLSSQSPADTLNTTEQVARVVYLFTQIWLQDFPEYKTENKQLSLWGYSYSGYFAPAVAAYIQLQNELITNGTTTSTNATVIPLGTVGLNNGCIDALSQAHSYPEFAHNNTYDIQVISDEIYAEATDNMTKPGGCLDTIHLCRSEAAKSDPNGQGNNATVNSICQAATMLCFVQIQGAFTDHSDISPFDLSLRLPATFPPEYPIAFYNQAWVQSHLGVPVNYTFSSTTLPTNFMFATGDAMRYDAKGDLEYLASTGVNVALIYGDRDYRCNWLGGENLSLAMDFPEKQQFREAGYAELITNGSYVGGLVRQAGNVSFVRVFQAGHAVGAWQPETFYQVYERVVSGRDTATGSEVVGDGYATAGEGSSLGHREKVPMAAESVCYLYDLRTTCKAEELQALVNGTAVVKDFVVKVKGAGAGGVPAGNGCRRTRRSGLRGAVAMAAAAAALPGL